MSGVQIDNPLHACQMGIQIGRDIADHLMAELVGQIVYRPLGVVERQPAYQAAGCQHRDGEGENQKSTESRLHSNAT